MIIYTRSTTEHELAEILALQKENLPAQLSESDKRNQGFVTVSHSMDELKKLNAIEQHLVIKDDDKVVGYLLAMTESSRWDIPVLVPMFELFDHISLHNKPISSYHFIVVGQVCIHKDYRGLGLLQESYLAYKELFQGKYDFAITEIATNNQRSINAHKKCGFNEIHRFIDSNDIEWSIVLWEWR